MDHLQGVLSGPWVKLALGTAALTVGATLIAQKNCGAPSGVKKYSIENGPSHHGGKLFAESLKNHGVKFVFTLIGGHVSPILAGCEEMEIRVIDVRHEVTTVFAADAVARLSGIPGVAVVTAGPGLTNTVTAVKNAQMAQSPIVLIGGATSDLLKGRGSLQDIDQMALIKPHVKWTKHVASISEIVPAVEEAFYRAQSGTPGPVFLEVAVDVLYPEKITRSWYQTKQYGNESFINRIKNWYINRHLNSIFDAKEITFHQPLPFHFPLASARKVERAAKALLNAKRPIIMIGSQTMLGTDIVSSNKLTDILNSMGIPIILVGAARGLLGQHNKLQVIGKDARRKAMKEADVLLLAGVPCDFRLDYGQKISSKTFFISVNRDQEDLYKNRSPSLPILGDPASFFLELSKYMKDVSTSISTWATALGEEDRKNSETIEKESKFLGEKINPLLVCKEIEQIAGENAIFIADGGDFVGSASYVLRPRSPLSWMDPGAFGTLGCGMGFAIGAKLCKPDSEIWVIFGDGAVGFSIAELDTCVRHNIPVIAVVGNDACWTQIYRDQVELVKSEVACKLAYTNYHDVCKGFGGEGILIKQSEEVNEGLVNAKKLIHSQQKPVLVNVLIGGSDFRKGSISM